MANPVKKHRPKGIKGPLKEALSISGEQLLDFIGGVPEGATSVEFKVDPLPIYVGTSPGDLIVEAMIWLIGTNLEALASYQRETYGITFAEVLMSKKYIIVHYPN